MVGAFEQAASDETLYSPDHEGHSTDTELMVTEMTSRSLQIALSSIFLLLGAWCLLAPGMVVEYTFRPELSDASEQARFLMGCFGAQAVLNGTILATARFTPTTFLVFGLVGSIPFFAFNAWFYFVEPVLNEWMLLDFAGNIGILTAGIFGWHLCRKEQATTPH